MTKKEFAFSSKDQKLIESIKKYKEYEESLDEPDWNDEGIKKAGACVDALLDLYEHSYSNLSEKTLRNARSELDFYIYEFCSMRNGSRIFDFYDAMSLEGFFGHWYKSHAMWSSASSIRTAAAALKKLMGVLEAAGIVSSEENQDMKSWVKENQSDWIGGINAFNDGYFDWQVKKRIKQNRFPLEYEPRSSLGNES